MVVLRIKARDRYPLVTLFSRGMRINRLPTDWVWGHKSRAIPNFSHLWTSPGPRSISENTEMAMTRAPSNLELTVWLKCSYEKEMYIHTYYDTHKSEAGMLTRILSDQ